MSVLLQTATGQDGSCKPSFGPYSEVTNGHFYQSLLVKERHGTSLHSEHGGRDLHLLMKGMSHSHWKRQYIQGMGEFIAIK